MVINQSIVPEEQAIDDSQIVVVGRLVDGPIDAWNQNNGRRWSMASERPAVEHPPAAFPVQRFRIDVDEIWRGNETEVSNPLEVVVIGNGIGKEWSKEGSEFSDGDRVVVLLSRKTIGWRDGPNGRLDVVTFSSAFNSLYLVEPGDHLRNAADVRNGEQNVNTDRSNTLRQLKDRVTRGHQG